MAQIRCDLWCEVFLLSTATCHSSFHICTVADPVSSFRSDVAFDTAGSFPPDVLPVPPSACYLPFIPSWLPGPSLAQSSHHSVHAHSVSHRISGKHMMMGGARTGLLLPLLLNDRGACWLQCMSLPVLSAYLPQGPDPPCLPGFAHTSHSFLSRNPILTDCARIQPIEVLRLVGQYEMDRPQA